MKTSTVLDLSRPLLVVALLVVSWAEAAPLQDVPDEDLREELQVFFKQNPAIAQDLYPDLVNEASDVSLTVDQDVVVDLLKNYMRGLTVEEIEDELEREAESDARRKRQTTVSGDIDASRNPFGKKIAGSASVTHALDNGRHSLSGTVGASRQTITGLGSADTFSTGLGYKFSPNEGTSFGINAQKSWTPAAGVETIGSSASVNRAWDNGRHSLSGTVGTNKHTIDGLGSANTYNAGVGYNFSPDKKTTFGINAQKTWTPAGSSNNLGLSFTRKFQLGR